MTDVSRPTPIEEGGALPPVPTEQQLREVAIRRLKEKRDFLSHLLVYVVVNIGLWVVWTIDGARDGWEFPWPVFPTVFWGLFVLKHANDVYWGNTLREDRVQREVEALRAESRTHQPDTHGT
jgi:hypothetical protein